VLNMLSEFSFSAVWIDLEEFRNVLKGTLDLCSNLSPRNLLPTCLNSLQAVEFGFALTYPIAQRLRTTQLSQLTNQIVEFAFKQMDSLFCFSAGEHFRLKLHQRIHQLVENCRRVECRPQLRKEHRLEMSLLDLCAI